VKLKLAVILCVILGFLAVDVPAAGATNRWFTWVGQGPYHFQVKVIAPDDWYPTVVKVLQTWSRSVAFDLTPVRVYDPAECKRPQPVSVCVGDVAANNWDAEQRAFGAAYTYNSAMNTGDRIVWATAILSHTTEPREAVLCHEIGHVLGLDHSDDPASCMTQGPTATSGARHDLEELALMHGMTEPPVKPAASKRRPPTRRHCHWVRYYDHLHRRCHRHRR
jgi:hypothetical protein